MASTVFGTPITKEYLRETGESKDVTKLDRAKAALVLKNADGKDLSARKYVESLVPIFGKDQTSTLCFIYNATGDPVTFIADHIWAGRICESPYPIIIQNGQWGAFLHGQTYTDNKSCKAAVVYSGSNSLGDECYWIMCFWNAPSKNINEVYCEVCKPSDYNLHNMESSDWGFLEKQFVPKKTMHKSNQNGGWLFGGIGNISKSCSYEAILTLPEAI